MMKRLAAFACVVAVTSAIPTARAASLDYEGTHYNVGGTFFPGGSFPYVVVPWHSDDPGNTFAVSNASPNRYYGTAGYKLFATQFTFPNQNLGYNGVATDPTFTDFFTEVSETPSFVANSQVLSTHMSAGWEYSLIDDPRLQEGTRLWTFDGTNYPPPTPDNITGGIPYVKLGLLQGNDVLGNNPSTAPAARWGFEVGSDVPDAFRVGVITDGLDGPNFAPTEVLLSQIVENVPTTVVTSGSLVRNRYVDIHFFDITGAQPGDQFVFAARSGPGDPAVAGISGFTFDVLASAVLEGDFNEDGSVDAADYVIWRKNNGSAQDYATWRANFGDTLPGGGSANSPAVPEPGTCLLVVGALFGLIAGRRR